MKERLNFKMADFKMVDFKMAALSPKVLATLRLESGILEIYSKPF